MHVLTDRLVEFVDSAPPWTVYAIACGMVYLETAVVFIGLVAPSEAVLVAAGVVAAVGRPQIGILVAGCAVAAVAGDSTGYLVGRLAGPRLSRSRLGRAVVRRTVRSGYTAPPRGAAIVTVASARWIGYVRSIAPLVAGTRRMPFPRYLLATAIGGISWTATILLVSWGVGATLGAQVALLVGIGVGVVALGILVLRRLRAR